MSRNFFGGEGIIYRWNNRSPLRKTKRPNTSSVLTSSLSLGVKSLTFQENHFQKTTVEIFHCRWPITHSMLIMMAVLRVTLWKKLGRPGLKEWVHKAHWKRTESTAGSHGPQRTTRSLKHSQCKGVRILNEGLGPWRKSRKLGLDVSIQVLSFFS